MGIKVQIDKNARQPSASKTSGLLLGTDTPHLRILYLVPTPRSPPGTSTHRWAVEHAKLIQTMCPGGLSILGTYLPLRGTSASSPKDLDSAAAIARDIVALHQNGHSSLVLCRGPKGRVVVKQVGQSPDDQLKTGDLKEVAELTNDVVSIRATFSIPQTLRPIITKFTTHVQLKSSWSSITDKLKSGSILQLPNELYTVVTSIDDSRNLAEIMGWKAGTETISQPSLPHEPIDVQLLTPICIDSDQVGTSAQHPTEGGTNFTSFQGSLHLEAIATIDGTVGDVLKALQEDLVRSLRARVDLLVESYLPDDDDGSESQERLDHPSFSLFPARVVASPTSATLRFLSLTEYLMPKETVDDDLVSRFLEAFSWDEEKLEEFQVEQKEGHHPKPAAEEDASSYISPRTNAASPTAFSPNDGFDVQFVMQSSLLAAFVLGFLAIVIKQLLNFW